MKLKSVSAENLANIVKQMINTALEDSDQIAKLHQAIYEEWYFMRMMELDARGKTESEDVPRISQVVKKSCTKVKSRNKNAIQEMSSCSSSNLTRNVLSRSKSMDALHNMKYSPRQDLNNMKINNRDKQLVKQTRRLSFESWKKEKNLKYRKLLREAEEKKQRELREKVKDIEYKKASQDACAQMIREKEAQQRELSARLQAIRQTNMEILQKHIDERRVINARAFDDWKRQKNIKLREAKLMTMENPLEVKKSARPIVPSSQFGSWLNQLNSVLHQKYLRERRHLVRSFYCQPTYYGAAATCRM
nr:PREDICTED: stress response protein nst1-like [Linepithema humile]